MSSQSDSEYGGTTRPNMKSTKKQKAEAVGEKRNRRRVRRYDEKMDES
jgi:hypothetical protein